MYTNEMIIGAIRSIVRDNIAEIDITELLYNHHCDYLLKKNGGLNEYLNKISEIEQWNRKRVAERYAACKELFYYLEKNAIPYAVIKGAVLSGVLYGDCSLRKSGDIDILVCREDVERVKTFLGASGFVQGRIVDGDIKPFSRHELLFQSTMSHQIAPFVKYCDKKKRMHVEVDINMDIMWGESAFKSDMLFVLKNTEPICIFNTQIRKLMKEMEFIALCLHHYKDMNSIYLLVERQLNLNLFCDIFLYIKNSELSLCKLRDFCTKLNVTQYIYYCLYYTNLIFDDAELKQYVDELKTLEAETILDSFGLCECEQQKWDVDFMDRLFKIDISKYLQKKLTPDQKKKIEANRMWM